MLLARKLMDSFMNQINAETKEKIYDLAVISLDNAMAKLAIMYEETFKDYPSGFVAELILQHLKDKVFQRNKLGKAFVA